MEKKWYGVCFPDEDGNSVLNSKSYPDPKYYDPPEFGPLAAKALLQIFELPDDEFIKKVWTHHFTYPPFYHCGGYWSKKEQELYIRCYRHALRYKEWVFIPDAYSLSEIREFPVVTVEFRSDWGPLKRSFYFYRYLKIKGDSWEDGFHFTFIIADKQRVDSLVAEKLLREKGIDLILGQNARYEFEDGKVIMRARNLTVICPEEEYNMTTIGNFEETSYIRGHVRVNRHGRVIFTVARDGNAYFFKNSAQVFLDKNIEGLLWSKVNKSTSSRGHSFVNTVGITDDSELIKKI